MASRSKWGAAKPKYTPPAVCHKKHRRGPPPPPGPTCSPVFVIRVMAYAALYGYLGVSTWDTQGVAMLYPTVFGNYIQHKKLPNGIFWGIQIQYLPLICSLQISSTIELVGSGFFPNAYADLVSPYDIRRLQQYHTESMPPNPGNHGGRLVCDIVLAN